MKIKKEAKRFNVILLLSALLGGIVGFFGVPLAEDRGYDFETELGIGFVLLILALMVQMVIHEAGHLVFGLLTGYKFVSFRVGSFMWVKREGKIHLCRYQLAGTGGQCLLEPPEQKDWEYPYSLYNMGGSIMNMLSAIVFAGVALVVRDHYVMVRIFGILALAGVIQGLMNAIPKKGIINNDGMNQVELRKIKAARRAFWIQIKVNALWNQGIYLRDMPEEWFTTPNEEEMKSGLAVSMGVLACGRLMTEKQFEKADKLMEDLLSKDSAMIGVHRSLCKTDQMYCEMVGACRKERIESLLDDDVKKIWKAMKNSPSILRTQYVYARRVKFDEKEAARIMEQFNKVAKTYPSVSGIMEERELMAYADQIIAQE